MMLADVGLVERDPDCEKAVVLASMNNTFTYSLMQLQTARADLGTVFRCPPLSNCTKVCYVL